ncbi:hypothetical protein Caci_1036 [Catenulispora acidiphila DSM 44928]|uniref:Low molecular weight protein antigen 6 PH domain-containing protein n=1 Tax=Catenulispora acidiphila (strain DSM 44928 / JCM 14897 / NBRC 102108 / NRRL B-24433 / ID139908) TaxID=479433 RepID=C7Q4A2_CATAD|nr:PH domain-containing protein [Catenulispora acidiphila]ACU69962.1 hypothetical protein Caci_1036 [Catenulispora acidiphila DSM 44928]
MLSATWRQAFNSLPKLSSLASYACGAELFPRGLLICHDLPVPSNMRFKLKLSPRGWVSWAFFAASPVIIPGLVSLTKPRPVHYSGLGYGLFAVAVGLIVLHRVRAATELEADGVRLHRMFWVRYLSWSEITGIEIRKAGKARLVQVRTSSGRAVRLPAPIAGGSYDGTLFDAQLAEITAAWKASRGETHEPGASSARSGSHRF